MKNIDITTSQNVTVQYALATVFERGVAFLLDLLVIGGLFLLLWALQSLLFPEAFFSMAYFVFFPCWVFYSLFFEQLLGGESPGKRVMKLRVMRTDGETAVFLDYFMRWCFKGLDVYFSLAGIGTLSIISSSRSQRVGDVLANTVVISIGKTERMTLKNLLALHKTDNYKVTYPQVLDLSEEHLMLVKETVAKRIRIDNEAHNEAFRLLVEQMQKELKVKSPGDPEKFLKTLLQDYIVLTR